MEKRLFIKATENMKRYIKPSIELVQVSSNVIAVSLVNSGYADDSEVLVKENFFGLWDNKSSSSIWDDEW